MTSSRPPKQYWVRINEIAGRLNVWLFAIAIALGFSDLSLMIWRGVASMAPPH